MQGQKKFLSLFCFTIFFILNTLFLLNIVNPFTFSDGLTLVCILLLLFISGFISSSETAFFSLNPQDLHQLECANTEDAQTVLQLREAPDYLLATILITNNFVNVAITVLGALFINNLFNFTPILEFIIQTVIITFILLLFGEIMPKVYASKNAVKVTEHTATTLKILRSILKPFAKILVGSTGLVNRKLATHSHNNLSVNELSQALELTNDSIDEDKDILEGIVRFGNVTVVNVMTSRLDMTTIDIKTPFDQVLKTIVEVEYSRIPIIDKNDDDIRGILFIKDLIPHLHKVNTFKWQTLIRPAYFVPETKKIDDLLQEFQKNRVHMAIVVDEFGGTSGIVTMEDILEEVVGDISDEYDDEELLYKKINNSTYIFEAKILLIDFSKVTNIPLSEFAEIAEEADTLAGLLLELKGEIPIKNEQIEYKNYTFEVLAADNRRIQKIKLIIHPLSPDKKTDEKD